MKTKRTIRRTEITVETDRVVVFGTRANGSVAWCSGCGRKVRMMRPENAAEIAGLTRREIYRLELGSAHYAELEDGMLLVCANSLL